MYNSNMIHDIVMREPKSAWRCPSTPPSNIELEALNAPTAPTDTTTNSYTQCSSQRHTKMCLPRQVVT
jgi:hypothetical protein